MSGFEIHFHHATLACGKRAVPTTQALPVILKGLLIVTLLIFNAALPVLARRNCWVGLVLKKGE